MKIIVQFKDPDALEESIREAMQGVELPDLSDDERQAVIDARTEAVRELCQQWFEYSEYLRVEVDTEAKTCTVLPVK